MSSQPETLRQAIHYHQAGDLQQAELCYRRWLQQHPRDVDALHMLGVLGLQTGRFDLAVVAIGQALAVKPDFAAAHSNLGNALQQLGRSDEAIASWRQALRLEPQIAEIHCNLGLALIKQNRLDEAEASLREALRLRPAFADAHSNLGNLCESRGDYAAAIHCYRQALNIEPRHAHAQLNMGVALHNLGQPREAADCYRQALHHHPNLSDAHFFLGMALLGTGDLEQGWKEYEWRWKSDGWALPNYPQPLWDGRPLQGRTILLYAEQHLGDTLQFIRYAELVRQQAACVLVLCPKALAPILQTARGIDRLLTADDPLPAFDVHAPLLNLPGILGTTLGNIPARVPYLAARPELVERWRQHLSGSQRPKIGICWQGTAVMQAAQRKAIPLAFFEPLAQAGAELISLQRGEGTEQIAAANFPLRILPGLDDAGAFLDTAAVMMDLDLIVSCDTAVAHVAGALARPVWVPLPFAADWRWLLDREDTPWYPTMRLFRQPDPGNWRHILARMAQELQRRMPQIQR